MCVYPVPLSLYIYNLLIDIDIYRDKGGTKAGQSGTKAGQNAKKTEKCFGLGKFDYLCRKI